MNVKIKKIHPDAITPTYGTKGAAGADLYTVEDVKIPFKTKVLIRTGLEMEIPEGYEVQIRPRSGLSFKMDLVIPNAPGTIDSDYRGEVKVMLHNTGLTPIHLEKGIRIAQMVLAPVKQATFVEEKLSETERGDGGFGSTGL